MTKVLITGANGQLGQCFKALEGQYDLELLLCSREALDISSEEAIAQKLANQDIDYLINCAAYTAVDLAEENREAAELINVTAVDYLAKACKVNGIHMIHISTDFVFDGTKRAAYLPTDTKNPQSVYGATKSAGEERLIHSGATHSIVRASWLYSNYANNFYKTILRLAKTKERINVVNDQIGIPDSAMELVRQLLRLISENNIPEGILHFAHSGSCSWMEFAQKIVELNELNMEILPISTEAYGAPAKRPAYSVMQQSSCFQQISWEAALKDVVLASKH